MLQTPIAEAPRWIATRHGNPFGGTPSPQYDPSAIGLAFSGGGYRATLFHTGAILRLNELGLLSRAARISGVSGGAIATGLLARAWPRLGFGADGVAPAADMEAHLLAQVLEVTRRSLDVRVSIAGFLPFVSAGNRLAALYDRHVFGGMMLSDLPARPAFVFNALNLQTQGLFRFTRSYAADWRALMSTVDTIRVADAVAASSAFPPVLAPFRLDLRGETVTVPEGARFRDPELCREPVLVDGGVYDNLGLESIWKRCGVIIGSYAGHNATAEPDDFSLSQLLAVVNSFLAASIDWRERMLVGMFRKVMPDGLPERIGAYWTAGTELPDAASGWAPTSGELERARLAPTRLEAVEPALQRDILRAGYGHADAAIRSHLMPEAPPPTRPPL